MKQRSTRYSDIMEAVQLSQRIRYGFKPVKCIRIQMTLGHTI